MVTEKNCLPDHVSRVPIYSLYKQHTYSTTAFLLVLFTFGESVVLWLVIKRYLAVEGTWRCLVSYLVYSENVLFMNRKIREAQRHSIGRTNSLAQTLAPLS